jgi:hypothetical protein
MFVHTVERRPLVSEHVYDQFYLVTGMCATSKTDS